eukprot:1195672-Prorocentrum_minimum.AAC.9
MSEPAKDLIRQLLRKDPRKRLPLQSVLTHSESLLPTPDFPPTGAARPVCERREGGFEIETDGSVLGAPDWGARSIRGRARRGRCKTDVSKPLISRRVTLERIRSSPPILYGRRMSVPSPDSGRSVS